MKIPFIDLKSQYNALEVEIKDRINTVLEHGQFIMGPEVTELESNLETYTGSKYCISVASGTEALLISLMALGVKSGDEVITTPFTFVATAEVIAILGAIPIFVDVDPKTLCIDHNEIKEKIYEGEDFEIITDKSPFYAEKGGQIGDTGKGFSETGEFEIIDTTSPYGGVFIHKSKMKSGEITKNSLIKLEVSEDRREKIKRNHTATHLLHAALREIIGIHVRQSGSLVHPDYLRFDFTNLESLSESSIKKVEEKVNGYIRNNLEVEVCNTTYNKAIEDGALAFFDDKYEHDVRTIKIDAPWSFELCGGTHMSRTGGIGLFKIVSEAGIGSGNRRIFATTGIATENIVENNQTIVREIMKTLSSNTEDVIDKFNSLLKLSKDQQKEIEDLQMQITNLSMGNSEKSTSEEFEIGSTKVSCSKVFASNIGALRKAGDLQRTKLGKGLVILGSIIDEKGSIVIMATDGVNIDAGELAKLIAKETNGGGGGNKFSAQVGIKDLEKFELFFKDPNKILDNLD